MAEATQQKKVDNNKKPAAPVAKSPEQRAADKAAKDAAVAKDRFVFVKDPEGKIAPQAQVIINAIKGAGAKGVTREELIRGLEGKLTTTQPIGRVVSYYQRLLTQETGAVRINTAEAKT